jgi:hypothetical protein
MIREKVASQIPGDSGGDWQFDGAVVTISGLIF